MAMPLSRQWTAADPRALTREDRPRSRYELIDGELIVTPPPRGAHQIAASEILVLLHPYLERFIVGFALVSPARIGEKWRRMPQWWSVLG